MDVVKLRFQKWSGGGLAGWFIRNYARRNRQFCRSPTVGERVQAVFETGTDPFPLTEADQAVLELTGGLYPFPNRRLQVPVDDRSFVGVAALRMSRQRRRCYAWCYYAKQLMRLKALLM